jgi:purine nucleosidase
VWLPLLGIVLFFISPMTALAQSPTTFWVPPTHLDDQATAPQDSASASVASVEPLSLIVDTDTGVDDAMALVWLLSQTQQPTDIRGIVSVAGNTTVENATKNVLTVLNKLGRTDIPVYMGAKKPLSTKLSSTGKLIHGKDGLWGLQLPNDLSSVSKDARKFYCDTAVQHPGSTIIALGPLTNIAEAIRKCGSAMQSYSRIVVLGGSKFGGNTTPVAEFNIWQDSDAAQIVLNSGLNIDLVILDAFTQLTFSFNDLGVISQSPNPAMKYLFPALALFAGVQTGQTGQDASIPDLAAMIYALQGLGTPVSALVKVVDKPDLVRGQTIIGLTPNERATMIASDKEISEIADTAYAISQDPVLPDFFYVFSKLAEILARVPDNANVVTDIYEADMRALFLDTLATYTANIQSVGPADVPAFQDNLFLPAIGGE